MKKMIALLLALLLAVPAFALADETRILVVETTDIHGYLMDVSGGDTNKAQYKLAYISYLIEEARDSGLYDDVILLDSGDLYQGTPLSNLTYGNSIRATIDAMGYDAVCLGNHDFDWSVTEYAADEEGTIPPYELGDYVGDPDVPVLASNLYDVKTGERVSFTRDYAIIEKAGKRIAVIGYLPNYRGSIAADKISPYYIDASYQDLNALIGAVNKYESPDATIILTHTSPLSVAQEVYADEVALIAGGHTHESIATFAKNGIACLEGRNYGNGFASAVLVIGDNGKVSVENVQLTDISDKKEALYDTERNEDHLDYLVMDISRTAWSSIQNEMSEVLGYIDTSIQRSDDMGSSVAGNWITGLMLKATESYGAQVAFCNKGGIRTNLNVPKGKRTRNITVYDVLTIAPFSNSLMVYDLTGEELAQQLADGLRNPNYGDQLTGLTFTYTATGNPGMDRRDREYTILSIELDDGTEVDVNDNRTLYRVCIPSFSATVRGSVFKGKRPLFPESDAPVDNLSMIEILRQEGLENNGYLYVDTSERSEELDWYWAEEPAA